MERITFVASIPATASAIKIDGTEGEGGRVVLELPGTEFGALLLLANHCRGKALKVTVQEAV